EIDQRIASGSDALESFAEKDGGIGALPLRIGGREKRSDVGRGDGAEQCVGDGVEQNVSIGVPAESFVVDKLDASDDERDRGLELVRVVTVADAEVHQYPVPSNQYPMKSKPKLARLTRRSC